MGHFVQKDCDSSELCLLIAHCIMNHVSQVSTKVLSLQGPPVKRSLNHGYDSRDDFNSPIGIIAMINRTINRGCDSRDYFNCPIGIIACFD